MRLHLFILTAVLISQLSFGESLRQAREVRRHEPPLTPERYVAPVEHDDIIALYNLSPDHNPVVLEVRDSRDPDFRHVITGGWLAPYQIYLLPVIQLSGDGLDGEPWKGTLWVFAAHKIAIYAGDGDHIHEAAKVPEHFGIQVDSYWRDLLEEGP